MNIKDLLQNAALNTLNEDAMDELPIRFVTDEMHVQNIEHHLPKPCRLRRKVEFTDLQAFLDYLNHRKKAGAEIYVHDMEAHAVLDPSTDGNLSHEEDQAHLELQPTQPYKELLDACTEHSQQSLVHWIEEHVDHITAHKKGDQLGKPGDTIPLTEAVTAIRNLTIAQKTELGSRIEDDSAETSAFASIDIKSKLQKPDYLTFTCKPYEGLKDTKAGHQHRTFTLRVIYLNSDKTPTIKLKMMAAEKMQNQMEKDLYQNILNSPKLVKDTTIIQGKRTKFVKGTTR